MKSAIDEPQCIRAAYSQLSVQPILEAFPDHLAVALQEAMISRGANADAASRAVDRIERACADWLYSGGHRYDPAEGASESVQKIELERLARDARALDAALRDISVETSVRLNLFLQAYNRGPLEGLLAPWNPDPIEVDRPGGLLSFVGALDRKKICLPANLAAKLERLRSDLRELAPALDRTAKEFKPKKVGNEPLRHFFRQAIVAWGEAVGEWPTAGLKPGHDDDTGCQQALGLRVKPHETAVERSSASSPLPGILRGLATAVLGEPPLAMNDAAFLRVLRAERRRSVIRTTRRGLFSRAAARPITGPRKGRPRKQSHKSI